MANNDLTRSVAGSCRSADDGSRTEESNTEDAMRQSSKPKPRTDEGSFPESARDESESERASKVSPKLETPMMRISIAERKRAKKARDEERREISHWAATEYEEMVKNAHCGYETFHQLPEGSSPPACLKNSSAGILGWAKYMETIKASKLSHWERGR